MSMNSRVSDVQRNSLHTERFYSIKKHVAKDTGHFRKRDAQKLSLAIVIQMSSTEKRKENNKQ